MVKHFNPTIALDTQRIFNLKSADMIPAEVGNMLVPVIPISRITNIIMNATSVGAAAVIYTTPTGKDFYLTGMTMSTIKDNVCPANVTYIDATVGGVTGTILFAYPLNAGAADSRIMSLTLANPIKIDRGTAITLNSNNYTALHIARCQIYGYTVETTI